ncbi:hypothetical protein FNF28_04524 [Cafeteria roenbergensis]|uniref:Uncharacterized protein n=1 Tax=Cafeteria roenbergensis TaxID=33653 RepID=A0A5A8DDW7_CAFRO|nr:hypothetical protein FNF28_04524 [Cafeteria roenbergensis]
MVGASWQWWGFASRKPAFAQVQTRYFLVPYVSPGGTTGTTRSFNENYGVLGILDSLHGTDTRYKEAMRRRDKAAATSK